MVLGAHVGLCVTAGFKEKIPLGKSNPECSKMAQNWGFSTSLKNFVFLFFYLGMTGTLEDLFSAGIIRIFLTILLYIVTFFVAVFALVAIFILLGIKIGWQLCLIFVQN